MAEFEDFLTLKLHSLGIVGNSNGIKVYCGCVIDNLDCSGCYYQSCKTFQQSLKEDFQVRGPTVWLAFCWISYCSILREQ